MKLPAASNGPLGLIRLHGWPLTKAGYLRAMFSPYDPTFPLDAEVIAAIPLDLPGEIPSLDDGPVVPLAAESSTKAPSPTRVVDYQDLLERVRAGGFTYSVLEGEHRSEGLSLSLFRSRASRSRSRT